MEIKKFLKNWRWVIAYVLFLYISLPVVPVFWARCIDPLGKIAQSVPFILLFVVFLAAVYYLVFVFRKTGPASFALMLISFLISAWFVNNLKIPAERIHIIEYGLLPFFIYPALYKAPCLSTESGVCRPLSQRHKWRIFVFIFIIGFLVGLLDEVIQYFIPNRVFDLRDILTNATGLFLGEMVLYSFK